MKVHDGLFLPSLQPMVARDTGVVFIGFAVPLSPLKKFAPSNPEPPNEPFDRQLGSAGPFVYKINDAVARVMGTPFAA